MDIDPHAGRLLAMVRAGRRVDPAGMDIAERRRGFADLMRLAGPAVAIGSVDDLTIRCAEGPRPARIYTPVGASSSAGPGLLYFHGGGLVAGGLDTHDALCRVLARDARCRVVAIDYRLAPEHPFPAAVEDAVAALADVFSRASSLGLDPSRIAIGGDSAGGTLATVAARLSRGALQPSPLCQFLLCPVLGAAVETASRRAFADGYLLDAGLMRRDLADYAPSAVDHADARVSPLGATDLVGLPPTVIHTAEFDPLRDEGDAYAERLRQAGVTVSYRCHAGMIHHFYGLTGFIPKARAILADIAADLGSRLGSQPEVPS